MPRMPQGRAPVPIEQLRRELQQGVDAIKAERQARAQEERDAKRSDENAKKDVDD